MKALLDSGQWGKGTSKHSTRQQQQQRPLYSSSVGRSVHKSGRDSQIVLCSCRQACVTCRLQRGSEENEETDKCSLPLTTARQLNCTSTAVLHLYFFPPSCSLNDSSSCSLDFSEQKIALSSMSRAMALSLPLPLCLDDLTGRPTSLLWRNHLQWNEWKVKFRETMWNCFCYCGCCCCCCNELPWLYIFIFLWCAFSNATFLWTTAAAVGAGASSASTTTTALCTSEPCEFRNFFFFSSVNFAFAHVCSIKALQFLFFFFFFLPWAPLSMCLHTFLVSNSNFMPPSRCLVFAFFIAHLLRRLLLLLLCTIEAR